jgi:hypothetical protein
MEARQVTNTVLEPRQVTTTVMEAQHQVQLRALHHPFASTPDFQPHMCTCIFTFPYHGVCLCTDGLDSSTRCNQQL